MKKKTSNDKIDCPTAGNPQRQPLEGEQQPELKASHGHDGSKGVNGTPKESNDQKAPSPYKPSLEYDEIREAAPAAVGKLIRSGADARSLYAVVLQLAGLVEEDTPALNRLGALLMLWELHESSDDLQANEQYWQTIKDLCGTANSEFEDLDSLQLGLGEVPLNAIGCAALDRIRDA